MVRTNQVQVVFITSSHFAGFEHFLEELCHFCDDSQTDLYTLWSRENHTSRMCKTGNHSPFWCTRLHLSLSGISQDVHIEDKA